MPTDPKEALRIENSWPLCVTTEAAWAIMPVQLVVGTMAPLLTFAPERDFSFLPAGVVSSQAQLEAALTNSGVPTGGTITLPCYVQVVEARTFWVDAAGNEVPAPTTATKGD